MCESRGTVARRASRLGRFGLPLAFLVLCGAPLRADDSGPTIVRVEEDWRLEVTIPDPDNDAPQVSCVIAPTSNVDFGYAEFVINHHSLPAFRPGGMQLQVWSNDQPIVVNNDPDGGIFSTPNEVVTWTQAMSFDDGTLTFSVFDGSSATWGNFGGDGRLKIQVAAPIGGLNDYDSSVSTNNSGIGFASNRVQSLKIVAVRRYTSDGQMLLDDTDRVVFERQ